jgi:UDP-glucose 4-epimerase
VRVAVTGGAGYVGSVVCEELVEQGHEVLVIDNLSKGHPDAIVEQAQLVRADLLDRATVTQVLADFGAAAVVHMAAASLVGESVVDPARYYRNNVTAGLALLDAMRDAEIPRLVFSSTAAVYGEPARQPIAEGDPMRPTNPYGETKLAFERTLGWFARAYGLSSISLRYFNAAGATVRCGERHDPETHLIPLVLEAAAGRLPGVTVFGDDYETRDGTCMRDYIHVSDLARAHVLSLHALSSPGVCDAYNLGCGGGYTVREVIDAAAKVTGRRIPVAIAPRRAGDPAVLVASSERIRTQLGWSPRFEDLDTIIASAWAWLERHARRSFA